MKHTWQPYPRDRKICYRENYIVIVPSSYDENERRNMPLFCGICDIRFGNKEDEFTYKKFGCCSPCADTWAYSNKEKWEVGWRPATDIVKNVIARRSFVDPNIVLE